jgi:hypothetical protein
VLLDFSQPRDPGHIGARNDQVLAIGAHAKPRAPAHEVLACSTRRGIVYADIEQMHAGVVFGVEPADVCHRARGLHHDGDAVELVMALMKDLPAQAAAPAPKCRSKAFTRSPAMDCGLLPSIWCRWTKCTTSPFRSKAIEGLLGW